MVISQCSDTTLYAIAMLVYVPYACGIPVPVCQFLISYSATVASCSPSELRPSPRASHNARAAAAPRNAGDRFVTLMYR